MTVSRVGPVAPSGRLRLKAPSAPVAARALPAVVEAVTAAPLAEQDFEVHMDYARLQENQVVLLCSDGVTAHLRDNEIAVELVKANFLGQDACKRIVDAVLDRGATDNTTVVIVDKISDESGENE